MQRSTPQSARPPTAFHPARLCGIVGEIFAALLLFLGLFLLALVYVLRVADVGSAMAIALQLFMMAAPYVAAIGGILCLVSLFFAEEAPWGTLSAIFLHLAVVVFSITSLIAVQGEIMARSARIEKFDKALKGKIDRKAGVYEAPGKLFRLAAPEVARAVLVDQYDEAKHHVSFMLTLPRVPYLMVEILPLSEAGAPAGISPADFVEFAVGKAGSQAYLLSEKVDTPAGPSFRIAFRKESAERTLNTWMTDNVAIGGWWVRLSTYDLAGPDAKADLAVLGGFLDKAWKLFSFNPPSAPEGSSKKSEPFNVPDSLSSPLDQEKYIKVPESAKLPPK